MTRKAEALLGERLGNYRITAVLGQGGMGVVYEAQHVSLPSKAAVKVLLDTYAEDQVAVQRFLSEAQHASSINDPHVVRIFDAGQLQDGRPYLVMELLQGTTLETLLSTHRFGVRRTVNLLQQIAGALDVVHGQGIVHRDLKPSNVQVTPSSRGREVAKVLDFGLARPHGGSRSVTLEGAILGTPHYMSPEQVDGKATDARADAYSFGCLAFEMLTGGPPFTGESVARVLNAHLAEPAPDVRAFRPDAPEALSGLIARCLAKSPDARPASMKEVVQALDDVERALDQTELDTTMDSPAGSNPSHPRVAVASAPETLVSGALSAPGKPRERLMGAGVLAVGVVAVVAALVGFGRWRAHRDAIMPAPAAASVPAITDVANPFKVTDVSEVAAGRAVWVAECAHCHGARGDGSGTDVPKGLRPKAFCDVVLPPGTLDVYYFGIVRHGVTRGGGVAMPSFEGKLDVKDMWRVVTFINTLRPPVHKVDLARELADGAPVETPELSARGADLFYTRCSTCHGDDGRGDGAASNLFATPATDLKDDAWNERTFVAGDDDLTHVYRTVTLGMGDDMGSFSSLSAEDRWAIARYVVSLRAKPQRVVRGKSVKKAG